MGNKTKIKTQRRLHPKGFKKNDKESRFNRIKTKNEEWTNKSEFDRITFLRNEFDNSPSLKKCHKFIQVLSKKFDVKFNLNNHGLIYRRCDGKSEKETCEMGIVYSFQNENGCIMFRPHTTTSIELFDFQINESIRRQGVGTDLLNDILDVVDSTDFKLIVNPSVSSDKLDKKQRIKYHFMLKEWFKSFGFKNQRFSSSTLVYEPKKESLKMTG
jgi:hypothetical protein